MLNDNFVSAEIFGRYYWAASIHDILRELRSVAYDERDKGDRFERLMQTYLTAEPQYAQLYSAVWMWADYPQRGTRRGTGIHLVARSRDTGELTAKSRTSSDSNKYWKLTLEGQDQAMRLRAVRRTSS